MSKTISGPLKAHLAQPVTTMTTCWLLIRLDGSAFGFTTLDMDLTISDGTLPVGETVYSSISGFSRSAIVSHTTGEIDNLEVLGYFSPAGIIAEDLLNGKYDYASVYVFALNWTDLSMGICRLRRGYLGECVLSQSGAFSAELRGLTQALVQEFGNFFSPLCRADLGDGKCKVPILPPAWTPGTPFGNGGDSNGPNRTGTGVVRPATQSSDAAIVATFFNYGPAGVTGVTEPAWTFNIGDTVIDGTISWVCVQSLRAIASVAALGTQSSFQASAMTYPGTKLGGDTATITFIGNITAGTALEITDGTGAVYSHYVPFDETGGTLFDDIVGDYTGGHWPLDMTMTAIGDVLTFTNHSGLQGNIQKSGDLVPGMRIQNFTENYLDGGTIQWISGYNAGVSAELKTFDPNTSSVILWLGMGYPIQVGDRFIYYAGCDKNITTCYEKFNNVLNNRSEPDMPGINRMLSYADAT